MLKKILSTALVSLLFLTNCFAQTATAPVSDKKDQAKLSHTNFYKIEPIKFDFEKDSLKRQKKNNLSSGAKTALWIGLFAAGVITVVLLATTLGDDKKTNSPCTAQITTPCPPGCVCIAQ